MSKRKKTFFGESLYKNMLTFQEYVDTLVELCISTFQYGNLPDTVDSRFIELALYNRGCAVYFNDEALNENLCLYALPMGKRTVYGVPVNRRAYSPYNNYNYPNLTDKNSVIIYNNMLRKPSFNLVQMYALRLWNIDRAIDVNVNAIKTPVLITCDEKQQLTMLNLYKEYEGNAPVIFGNKSLSTNDIQVLNTNAPYVSDKLFILKTQIWNEALTKLGIANVNTQKRERLVQDEIGVVASSAIACRLSRLNARKQAVDKINKMFGTNITVEFNEMLTDMLTMDSTDESEGNDNE